jgi:hypothetical protein
MLDMLRNRRVDTTKTQSAGAGGHKAVEGSEWRCPGVWEDMPLSYRWGSFCKRERFFRESVNPRTGKPVRAKRTRVSTRSFKLDPSCEQAVEMIFAPFWPAEWSGERQGDSGCSAER